MTRLRAAFCLTAAATLLFLSAGSALAGELQLTIAGGRVTLIADNVPLRTILTEWARIGETKIVNGEKLTGGPVTLRLVNVPEAQALDTLLRSASGYMAAPRAAGNAGPSQFDRILILASSRPTQTGPPPSNTFQNMNRPFQVPPPMIQPVEADDDQEADEEDTPPNAAPQPNMGLQPTPGFQPVPVQPGVLPPGVQQPPVGQVTAPVTLPRPGLIPPPQPQPQIPQSPNRPIP